MPDDVPNREDFAHLCNQRELWTAVEVGTDQGCFAADFMRRWRGHTLVCVDPYLPYGEMNRDRLPDLLCAASLLAPFAPRTRICKTDSLSAAKEWADKNVRFGFVYIDGAHDLQNVRNDLAAWWPRVKPGGFLAGHDYDDEHGEVVQAVTEFAAAKGLSIQTTRDANTARSWYVEKVGEQ